MRLKGGAKFTERSKRPRWGTLLLVGVVHVVVFAGLVRAFAPDFSRSVLDQASSLVTVTVDTPPPPPPPPEPSPEPSPEPDEGAAGEEGRRDVPQEVTAPPVPRPVTSPVPRAASTGTANTSGASEQGRGTGAGGQGEGTGSGRAGAGTGAGQGGVPITRPVKIAGDINDDDIEDFPIPPGGRESRIGQSVTVYMTVGVDGRASDCRVARPSNDPAADRLVCQLAVQRFRFRPATDVNGDPVPATYGWRQDFFRRD